MNARIRKSRVLIILLVLLKVLLPLFLSVSLCFASALRALRSLRSLARSTAFASSLSRKRLFDGSWATLGRSWVLFDVLFLSVDLLCDRFRTGLFYRPFRGCIAPLASLAALARSLRSRNLKKILSKSIRNPSKTSRKPSKNLCKIPPKFKSEGSF